VLNFIYIYEINSTWISSFEWKYETVDVKYFFIDILLSHQTRSFEI